MKRQCQPTEQMYLGTICKGRLRFHVLFLCSGYLQVVAHSCDFLQYSVSTIIFDGFFKELWKDAKEKYVA